MRHNENPPKSEYVKSGRYMEDILNWEAKNGATKYIIEGKKIKI